MLIGPEVTSSANELKSNWAGNWVTVHENRGVVDALVADIDDVRDRVKKRLDQLE